MEGKRNMFVFMSISVVGHNSISLISHRYCELIVILIDIGYCSK